MCMRSVCFHGVDDALQLPAISTLRALSVWLKLPLATDTSLDLIRPTAYLFDNGDAAAELSTHNMGSRWAGVYVDGNPLVGSGYLSSLPTARWIHLHADATAALPTAAVLLYQMEACATDVLLWAAPLSGEERDAVRGGFRYNDARLSVLVAHYRMEEGWGNMLADAKRQRAAATLLGRYVDQAH
jgi:hypothetical protein